MKTKSVFDIRGEEVDIQTILFSFEEVYWFVDIDESFVGSKYLSFELRLVKFDTAIAQLIIHGPGVSAHRKTYLFRIDW